MEEDGGVASAKLRCRKVVERVRLLPCSTNITLSCKQTLTRLALSDLSYLSSPSSHARCPNIGHLEALVHLLHQPFVSGVSRVCTHFPPHRRRRFTSAHVDLVCTVNGNPTWFVVSTRNPSHITFNDTFSSRINHLIAASSSSPPSLQPHSIVFFFAKGIPLTLRRKMEDEFYASDFLPLFSGPYRDSTYPHASALEVKPDRNRRTQLVVSSSLGIHPLPRSLENLTFDHASPSFGNLLSQLKTPSKYLSTGEGATVLVNFDTTAMVAVVSGISNGCWGKLLTAPAAEMGKKFKGNVGFVVGQAESEGKRGLHGDLHGGLHGKVGIVCETARSEFVKLVEMYGGGGERWRSALLLQRLVVVPDLPSTRVMSLGTSRRVGTKNKVVFGTGDYWHATTLTANSAFLRAVSMAGMALSSMEHRARALTGD